MKRWIALVLTALLLLTMTACGGKSEAPAAQAPETKEPVIVTFSGGTGLADDPYLIATADDLWAMAKAVNTKGTDNPYCAASYKLTADIDLGGKEWQPLGVDDYGYTGFNGLLEGDGHTVSNFTVTYTQKGNDHAKNHAFIGYLNKGTVRNLTISNASVTVKSEKSVDVAGVVASARNAVVENCRTTATVTVTSDLEAAGIVCNLGGDSVLTGCVNAAVVKGGMGNMSVGSAAGIVHYADSPVTSCINQGTVVSEQEDAAGIACMANAGIADCVNNGDVHGENGAAGIVCSFSDGALNSSMNDDTVSLTRCRNTGAIVSATRDAGGIAESVRTGCVVDCVNEGAVTAPQHAGGIFAFYQRDVFGEAPAQITVTGCVNSGSILCDENYSAGGICGKVYGSSTRLVFADCENTGVIAAAGQRDVAVSGSYAGGIIGEATLVDMEVTGCVNTGSITGFRATGGIIGLANPANLEGVAEFSLVLADCRNSGKVYTVNSGGLTAELYAGGILGYTNPESVADGTLKTITDLRMENCVNTGILEGDTNGALLRTDDLCAAWQSDLH